MSTQLAGCSRTLGLSRHRSAIVALTAWSALQVLPALVSGRLIATAVDRGFLDDRFATGVAWLVPLGVAYVVSALAVRHLFPHLGAVVEAVRDTMVERVVGATLRRGANGGRVPDTAGVSRMTQQAEVVRDALGNVLLAGLRTTFTVIATLAGLASLAPLLLAIVVPPVLVCLVAFACLVRIQAGRQHDLLLAQELAAATVTSVVSAVRDIRAFGAEDHMLARADAVFCRNQAAAVRMARTAALRSALVAAGAYVPLGVLVVMAPWLLRRHVTIGDLLGAATYLRANLEPVFRSLATTVGGSAVRLAVALRRIDETSRIEENRGAAQADGAAEADGTAGTSRPAAVTGSRTSARYDVELRDVTFRYGPRTRPVLDKVDLRIAAGEHLAVVGPSGVGKSTLASLVAGLVSPQQGRVLIGGISLAEADPAWLRMVVTLIPQESYVFTGTLTDNLTYLRPGASRDELDRAVARVGAAPVIDRLGGYDAEVSPAALSAGERQLVALARAYLSTAPVTILDEATCHLDPRAEERAERAFMSRRGTLVVIAHRISSARRAARILLLDADGAHVGSHHHLRRIAAGYADMAGAWDAAAGQ